MATMTGTAAIDLTRSGRTTRRRRTRPVLLVPLKRRQQLLELLLVRRDRLPRAGELDEHVASRAFDDRTEQAIARDDPRRARDRAADAGVYSPEGIDGRDCQAAGRPFDDTRRRRFAPGAWNWLVQRSRLASTDPP